MNRELITDPLGRDDMWVDLRTNVDLLKSNGYGQGLVFFGFAWGRYIYENQWHDLPMALDTLIMRVQQAEEMDWGRLGMDNLYLTIEPLSIRLSYSHEADIHLAYAQENDLVKEIRSRWLDRGWLTETLKSRHYQR